MSLRFDEENKAFMPDRDTRRETGMLGFLLRNKIARDEKEANKILLIAALVIIMISIVLFVLNISLLNRKPKPIYKVPAGLYKKLPPEMQKKLL